MPQPGNIIASNFTSPIDSLYLAAIFDPVFTVSYPHTRHVQQISLLGAMFRAISFPVESPSNPSKIVPLAVLQKKYPKRVIVVFPECTTTNGKGILPFSPSLLSADEGTKIFPISLRYSPQDMTTPIPGWMNGLKFLWCLCGRMTSTIRVRIAQAEVATARTESISDMQKSINGGWVVEGADSDGEDSEKITTEEQKLLDKVSEALARLTRVKRVGLTVKDKVAFVQAWRSGSKAKRK